MIFNHGKLNVYFVFIMYNNFSSRYNNLFELNSTENLDSIISARARVCVLFNGVKIITITSLRLIQFCDLEPISSSTADTV